MRILLNDGWRLRGFEPQSRNATPAEVEAQDGEWLAAAVPGDVHSTLLQYGKIADPFYSTNVEKCRWVEDQVWWYRKEFRLDHPLAGDEVAQLQFDGLDTYATVFLNGEAIGTHQNMFTAAVFDVTRRLKPGVNQLAVRFDSTMALTARQDYDRMWYSYSPNRVWVRKAQMNFRWDWGPRLITVGIWKDVVLQIHRQAQLDQVFVWSKAVHPDQAELQIELAATLYAEATDLTARIDLVGNGATLTTTVALEEGSAVCTLTVAQPRLWWTHDLGEPYLYDCVVSLQSGSAVLDTYQTKVGIRSLEVKQQGPNATKRFTFVLNGVEIFAKGANWVPAHSLVGTISDDTYRRWIELAQDSNMNMLRVWGGGIYEKAIFYTECDRRGILIWQDFMFTCSSYPDFDAAFLENVRQEISYVVKRLRNHAALAIWCGNNEIQWLHGQKLPDLPDLRLYGEKIFHDLMPEMLATLDPTRLYWPSSPFGGNDPNSDSEGDKHNWQVWAGQVYPHQHGERMVTDHTPAGIAFKKYAEDQGKFISEFGMHAAPVVETLKACIPPEQLYWGSFELRYRNKDKRPTRGTLLMQSYTGLPANLDQYIDYSMLAQAEGLKFGIEHYRRRKPDCSGTLIWQLNDCWPALSWSIVDFYLRPKAGYYYTKRVYQPILLSWQAVSPDRIALWVTNDTLQAYQDQIEIGLQDFFGNPEYREVIEVVAPPNAAVKVKEVSKNRINVTYTNFEFLYAMPRRSEVNPNLYFFEDYQVLNLPDCNLTIVQESLDGSRLKLRMATDNLAKMVKLQLPDNLGVTDNYFDLMPKQQKTVVIYDRTGSTLETPDFSISALNQVKHVRFQG